MRNILKFHSGFAPSKCDGLVLFNPCMSQEKCYFFQITHLSFKPCTRRKKPRKNLTMFFYLLSCHLLWHSSISKHECNETWWGKNCSLFFLWHPPNKFIFLYLMLFFLWAQFQITCAPSWHKWEIKKHEQCFFRLFFRSWRCSDLVDLTSDSVVGVEPWSNFLMSCWFWASAVTSLLFCYVW